MHRAARGTTLWYVNDAPDGNDPAASVSHPLYASLSEGPPSGPDRDRAGRPLATSTGLTAPVPTDLSSRAEVQP